MRTIQHFVNGKVFSGESKKTGKVFNPATGEQSAEVKLATTNDVNEAVKTAKKAFINYRKKYLKYLLVFCVATKFCLQKRLKK